MKRYKIIRALARPFIKAFFRYKVEGKENLPQGPYVLCANHVSMTDPMILACSLKPTIRFVAKSELKGGLMGFALRQLNVIYINRETADLGAIRQCLSVLKEGQVVGIFPQGTRIAGKPSADQAQEGVSMICTMGKVSAVPVAVVYEKGVPKFFRRTRIIVGKPIPVEEFKAVGDRAEQSKYIFGKVCELMDNGND